MGRPRIYRCNESYFSSITSEEKAYFFGLLCADGCNFEPQYAITLKLQARDRKLVYAFRKAIGYTGKVHRRVPCGAFKNAQRQYSCVLRSKVMSLDLTSLGCVHQKTSKLKFPSCVPRELMGHFIRGFFDGDGSIYGGVQRTPVVSFLSTKKFCVSLKHYFSESGIKSSIRKVNGTYELTVVRIACVKLLFHLLYDSATIFLPRKRDKFIAAVNRGSLTRIARPADESRRIQSLQSKQWRLANPEKVRHTLRKYREKHREKIANRIAGWREQNRERLLKYSRSYEATRRKRDPIARRKYATEWARRKRERLASMKIQ